MVLLAKFLIDLLCAAVSCEPSFPHPEISRSRARSINLDGLERDEHPIVWTNSGGLQGYTQTSSEGRKFYAFEGIPFAEPPVGNLRFRDPVPVRPWKGIQRATQTSSCIQIHPLTLFRVAGREDCLHLNIYTPKLRNETRELLPVIIMIHGGSFVFGSGAEMGAAYLMNQDSFVVTTINYRLGPLGFLSTGDGASPGNYGLKDQVVAMEWIVQNIESFGGDPTRLFLFGFSAGAVSVQHHMIYNKGIRAALIGGLSISGNAFVHWAVQEAIYARRSAERLGRLMRCPVEESEALVACLRQRNPHRLIASLWDLVGFMPFPPVLFLPVIEPEGPNSFITEMPAEVYKRGDVAPVPWVSSIALNEGHSGLYILKVLGIYNDVKKHLEKNAPIFLNYRYLLATQNLDLEDISKQVKNFYLKDKDTADATEDELSDMLSDRYFFTSFEKALKLHSKVGPSYGYLINYKSSYNTGKNLNLREAERGVAHVDDVAYYTNMSKYLPGFKQKDPEYKLSRIMINMLTNLIHSGVPTYTDTRNNTVGMWDPISPSSQGPLKILNLDKDIKMISFPFGERVRFWESLGLEDTVPLSDDNIDVRWSDGKELSYKQFRKFKGLNPNQSYISV